MTLNLVLTASLVDAQHYGNSVQNKSANLLVMPLGETLSGIPRSWCGRQMADTS